MDLSSLSTDDLIALRSGDLSKLSDDGLKALKASRADDPNFTEGTVRAAATGVPVVGGLLNKMDAGTDSVLSYLLNPLYDQKDQLQGSLGERYNKALATQQGLDQSFATQHPIADTAAKLAGGTAAGVMLPGAMFGAGGGLARQAGMGALSNAGIGGLDAATRGGDVGQGAAVGGVFGMLAPAAAPLLGKVAGATIGRFAPNTYGKFQVARAIGESGQTPDQIAASVQQAAQEGQPQYNLADAMGNAGQRLLSTAARGPGPGRTAIVDALEGRQAGQGRRVANALSEGFGTRMTPEQLGDAMTAERGAIADENYGAVRDDAQPVDVQNVLDHIDANVPAEPAAPDTISGRLQRYRRMLTNGDEENPENLSDFTQLQRVRSELSDEIQSARQGGQGNKARMLGQVLRQLDTSLENASQGFRQANADFAGASRNINAIDAGNAAAMRGRTEDTISAFDALSPRGQQAFRTGYASPLIESAQSGAYGANKARPLTSDAFQDEAAAMASGNPLMQRQLNRENTMFETRGQALGGSKTADNLSDAEALAHLPGVIGHVLSGNVPGALRGIMSAGGNALSGNTPAVRNAVANFLLLHGGQVNPAQLNALVSSTIARIHALQNLAASTTRAAAPTINSNQRPQPRAIFQ